jgi:TDG/mug DNA glycosylase family protein
MSCSPIVRYLNSPIPFSDTNLGDYNLQPVRLSTQAAGFCRPAAWRGLVRRERDRGAMPNHRISAEWMGEAVETLEDLLRPGLRAVCVGINPSPVSVAAGHYYQGRVGQRFFARLRSAALIPAGEGYEDDLAFAEGVGFTDIVKRPTPNAKGIAREEYEYGKQLLAGKLIEYCPELVIFTFKKTAEVLFGKFAGNGFVEGLHLSRSEVFVVPGPYEAATSASATLQLLAKRLAE